MDVEKSIGGQLRDGNMMDVPKDFSLALKYDLALNWPNPQLEKWRNLTEPNTKEST